MSEELVIGVLGGSGLYAVEGLENIEEVNLTTPFGAPSDTFFVGQLEGRKVVFLPRHGRGHRILPSDLNFRANIWGMKALGVTRILSVSAVGSMREDIAPGDFVVIDQFYDRTRRRVDTFFGEGIVGHVMFGDPVCKEMRATLLEAAKAVGVRVHDGGTYLGMEGPQFSTRAESNVYRQWGADVIGMTNLQEAKLAREAEICYATVAMATDYDCWHDGHDDVSADAVVQIMNANVGHAREMIVQAVPRMPATRSCPCGSALQHAIVTDKDKIPLETRTKLALLIDKYL